MIAENGSTVDKNDTIFLIGSALLKCLISRNGLKGRPFLIYAAGRDVEVFQLKSGEGVKCVACDALSFAESNAIEWKKP